MGDAEESADSDRYYCRQVEQADGFVRPMARLTHPGGAEHRCSPPLRRLRLHRPIQLSLALSAGMSSAALVAGNASSTSRPKTRPGLASSCMRCTASRYSCRRVQILVGRREEIGDPLWQHPGMAVWCHRVPASRHANPRRSQRPMDQAMPPGAGWKERDRRPVQRRSRCCGRKG